MQFDRTVGPSRIVNAGSVGVPFAPPVAETTVIPDVLKPPPETEMLAVFAGADV